eukprot:COSAG01_NODE_8825_length_2647_cov_166.304553_2_plen_448_part_00
MARARGSDLLVASAVRHCIAPGMGRPPLLRLASVTWPLLLSLLLLHPQSSPCLVAAVVNRIGGSWRAQPLHVPTRVTKQADAVDGPLLGNGAVGAVLGGPANNLTWYIGANSFLGGPSSGSSHCGYGVGGALQLGGLTVQTTSPLLADASWIATQNITRSFVESAHASRSTRLVLSTRSFVAATDSTLEVELSLASNATVARAAASDAPAFLDFNISLWTAPEMTWDECSGNTVAFSGCGGRNGSRVPCNSSAAGASPTLFAARSTGFSWQHVRSRGRGDILEHGDWPIYTQVLSLQVLTGGATSAIRRAPLVGARSVGDDQHDGGMTAADPRRLPNRGNHGASARVRLAVGGSLTLQVVIRNQTHVGYQRGLARGTARLQQLQSVPGRAGLRQAHDRWWTEYWNASWVSLPFSPLLETYYYGAQYLLAVSSRAGRARRFHLGIGRY